MKLSASAATNNGEIVIATYNSGVINLSRNDGNGLTIQVGSINSCDDLEAVCLAAVALLVKLKQKGYALSSDDRVAELQHDLRKLTLKTITDEDNVVKDVGF